MKKINLIINKQPVAVPENSTILDAARSLNIHIPTLCYLEGCDPFTSCMVCVVHETESDRLLPSCSVRVSEGMVIDTESDFVKSAQKDTLDMLLIEHVGDCEAPCQRTCPANMDIPLMIRQIKAGKFDDALITVKRNIALPAVLGRICPAPCEAGCKRKPHDAAVSICLLKRFAADLDLVKETPFRPEVKKKSGKRTAVIGAGPAGLSAAYYLLQEGHDCHLYDQNEAPGGALRYSVDDDVLPKSVLDAEIEQIRVLGAHFHMSCTLGKDIRLDQLKADYDSVILTVGKIDPDLFADTGINLTARGIEVDKSTFETSVTGVFAGGNALSESKRAIRACAHGKFIAESVNQMLSGLPVTGPKQIFNSVMGRIQDGEAAAFLQADGQIERVEPAGGVSAGYLDAEAVRECGRCFECDCRKPDSCKLRNLCDDYRAVQQRYKVGQRRRFERIVQHDLVVYEPGKCIKCGLCVRITKKEGETLGLSFVGRGFNVRIEVPFNESISQGLQHTAAKCVEACPTAALAWLDREREQKNES